MQSRAVEVLCWDCIIAAYDVGCLLSQCRRIHGADGACWCLTDQKNMIQYMLGAQGQLETTHYA